VAEITEEAWWEQDLQTLQLKNSRRFIDILGLGEEMLECTVSAHRELIHPDDRERVQAAFDLAIRKGTVFREAYRVRHAKGHYVWVGDHGRIVARDAEGNPTRILGIISDITARKEAEIALQESEANFRHFFETMTVSSGFHHGHHCHPRPHLPCYLQIMPERAAINLSPCARW
jgi:PAS domain S-box-containing protein